MKRLFVASLLFFLSNFAFAQTQNIWGTDFEKALKTASQENKMLLLYFSGSDWCAPCVRLKNELYKNSAFLEYANKNLCLVQADFPRKKKNQLDEAQVAQNEKLAEKYNQNGAFPLSILFDKNGKILQTWEGFIYLSAEDLTKKMASFK